ncbi:MAG TPA: Kdo hydroxylase family protein [Chthoniobacteraceae bacterium]|jgi:hypothetical protein|nr:Kdo hydroxylase family protein [Chthoniobacteraceae bacterium]
MNRAIEEIDVREWSGAADDGAGGNGRRPVEALEGGQVLLFPRLAFALEERERGYLTPAVLAKSKNVSFNPATGKAGGTSLEGAEREGLATMMSRFSASAKDLVDGLLPEYRGKIGLGRTSFRPAEIAGRASSWRKNDTLLHIDAFPSTPTHGDRILRLFCNVNAEGKPRVWRVGEHFERVAERFAPGLRRPGWGSSTMLRLLGITKSRRTEYDHLMLELHDAMKQDSQYQGQVEHTQCEFPSGSAWAVFVDSVSHAAMSGQHQLEQTFYLPLSAMHAESHAPLRVLERRLGRRLA